MVILKSKRFFIISLAVFLLGIATLAVIAVIHWFPLLSPSPAKPTPPSSTQTTTTTAVELPENPIDFAALKEQNDDIYAWIRVPGTEVDHPVLQSSDTEPEDFYLNHDINKKYKFAGSIYSQRINLSDFTDANTVLYGHNMCDNKTMFSSLLRYRKKAFFDENRYIYIYTPGHILTYTIYAAYRYDNRHILYSFDCNNREVFEEYVEITKNPKTTIKNIRDDIDVTADDRIITLSTCITNDNYRYLIQGVLTDDQPTR